MSSIPCDVYANSSANVLVLTKLDPKVPDWGEYEWHFEVIQKQNQYSPAQTWYGTNAYAPYANGDAYMNNGGEYYEGTGGSAAGNNEYEANYGEAASSSDTKACPACTYQQPAHLALCEMCSTRM